MQSDTTSQGKAQESSGGSPSSQGCCPANQKWWLPLPVGTHFFQKEKGTRIRKPVPLLGQFLVLLEKEQKLPGLQRGHGSTSWQQAVQRSCAPTTMW